MAQGSEVSTLDALDAEAVRCARAQALVREVNEQLRRLRVRGEQLCEIVCECGDDECLRPLRVGTAEYSTVRLFPGRFIVAPGHEDLEQERIVEDHGGYVVVEKFGAGAITAIKLDPRREQSRSSG